MFHVKHLQKYCIQFQNTRYSIDAGANSCYNADNLKTKTVEAEITAMMPLQRARGAESRVRNKSSNGPQRAQGTARFAQYAATCWLTLVVGDMMVSC